MMAITGQQDLESVFLALLETKTNCKKESSLYNTKPDAVLEEELGWHSCMPEVRKLLESLFVFHSFVFRS